MLSLSLPLAHTHSEKVFNIIQFISAIRNMSILWLHWIWFAIDWKTLIDIYIYAYFILISHLVRVSYSLWGPWRSQRGHLCSVDYLLMVYLLCFQIANILDSHAATLNKKSEREVFFMNTQSIVQLVQKWVS